MPGVPQCGLDSLWWLYDSSGLPPKLIAVEGDGPLVVKQKRLYRRIEQQSAEYHEESN
jgi:hypothetical protein